ncbi:hypothetical protein RDI58_029135 [Solanum bulbocastanum]|uniref:Uncharacterized protein n=1 Tax=Solanum bulbocastanum TaxID=147425 RepID=A0AAN8SVT4_SOLBU
MAYMVDKPTASSSKLAKAKKKKKKPHKVVAPRGSKGGVTKSKDKYFHCKKSRHHNSHCPECQEKMKNKCNSCLNIIKTG